MTPRLGFLFPLSSLPLGISFGTCPAVLGPRHGDAPAAQAQLPGLPVGPDTAGAGSHRYALGLQMVSAQGARSQRRFAPYTNFPTFPIGVGSQSHGGIIPEYFEFIQKYLPFGNLILDPGHHEKLQGREGRVQVREKRTLSSLL